MDRMTQRKCTGTVAVALAGLAWTAACAPRRVAVEPPVTTAAPARDTATRAPSPAVTAAQAPASRVVPYEGAIGPSEPPQRVPAMQRPLEPWVQQALGALYERPPRPGPAAIPVAVPKAIYVVGRGPVIQALPGPMPYADRMPARVREAAPAEGPFSNTVRRARSGTIRLVAFDRTLNDTRQSRDSMAVELSFTDGEGHEWRIEQAALAPLSPNPVAEPWFGGLAIDTLYHGTTGNGTPAVPTVTCAMCSWGWADVYRDGQRVASSAPLHVMVTSDTRGDDFHYACYDCTRNPVREVHVVIDPSAHLPTPGGFLHVMWENADVRRGAPDQIARVAPRLAQDVPTIELAAAPYLRWDKSEIRLRTGQKYRLLVHNMDPSSFHQIHVHGTPSEAGQHGGGEGIRHTEGETAGGTGSLWRPPGQGEAGGGGHHGGGDMPGPRNVFFGLPQGATWATYVQFDEPGEYEYMCPVGNHYRRGMVGKFIVEGAAPARRPGGAR